MKVKKGMNGTGKGRWCRRAEAKKTCNSLRRAEDKAEVADQLKAEEEKFNKFLGLMLGGIEKVQFGE